MPRNLVRSASPRHLLALGLAAVVTLCFQTPAWALDHHWINPAGGFSYDASNWTNGSGPSVPGPNDVAYFSIGGHFNVTWDFPVDSVGFLESQSGDPRFNMPSRLGVGYETILQSDSATFLSGTLGTPTLHLAYSGGDCQLLVTGLNTSIRTNDSTSASYWGQQLYPVWVRVADGANITCNGYIVMAPDSGGRCSTTVTGRNTRGSGTPSRLSTLSSYDPFQFGTRGDITAGGRGSAVIQVMDGAQLNLAGDLYIASGVSSTSMVHVFHTVGGPFPPLPSATVQGNTYIGSNDGNAHPSGAGSGTFLLENGSASLLGRTRVGGRGQGQLTVRNGTLLTAGSIWVGPESTASPGQFSLRGSTANLSKSLAIAGDSLAPSNNPNASAVVDSSGALNCNGGPPVQVWGPSGLLSIKNGSQVTSSVEVRVGGTLSLINGTLTAPLVTLTGTGKISGPGRVAARVHCPATGTVETLGLVNGLHLTVGDSTASDGFSGLSALNMYGDTLELLDLDGSDLGNITMGSGGVGGTLIVRKGARLLSGEQLFGYGNIVGDFVNEGSLRPVVLPFNFSGHLTHLTGTVGPGASSIHILSTGALTARGAMALSLTLEGAMDMGPTPAKLAIGGSVTMAPTATSRFRLGRKSNGVWDTLSVGGSAQFDGVLALQTIPGNEPVAGDTIPIATMGSMSHAFASVTINGAPAAGFLTVIYGPNVVNVVILQNLVGIAEKGGPAHALRFFGAGSLSHPAFALELPGAASVQVAVYDVTGREVGTLSDEMMTAGRHEFALPRSRFASGVCFARAVVTGTDGRHMLTARVLVIR